MNKETLKYIYQQFLERSLPAYYARSYTLPLGSGKIITLVGVRRSGKTFLLFELIDELKAQGVQPEQIIYLNFEDDRLHPIQNVELDLILHAHGELFPHTINKKRYLFFDEVQNVPDWQRYVRRIYDTENVEIFLTGSSSKLLVRDISTALRGRTIFREVFPLSFNEFLHFKGLSYTPYSRDDELRMHNALEEYVAWGGLPEVVLAEPSLRPLILEEYTSLLLFRDLIERYQVRNEPVMRYLLKLCFSNPATLISAHKVYRDLNSAGYKVSKNTIYEYLHYLEDAYIVFSCPLHTSSVRKQEQNPRKYYVIDTGLIQAYRAEPERDRGRKLENVVFLHERYSSKEIFYYKNKHEIDLVVGEQPQRFLNVTWSLEDRTTAKREYDATLFGKEKFPSSEGKLLSHEGWERVDVEERFDVFSAWKYLLI